MAEIKWVWSRMKGLRGRYLLAMFFSLLMSGLSFVNPMLSQILVDDVLIGAQDATGAVIRQTELLIPLVIAMIAVTLVRSGSGYLAHTFAEFATKPFDKRMRDELYQRLMSLDQKYFNATRTGDIMTRFTGDMEMIRHAFCFSFRQLFINIVIFITVAVYFMTISVKFTLMLLAVTPLVLLTSFLYFRRVRPLYAVLRERLSELNICAQENIEGNRVIKAFANEDFETEKFKKHNDAYRDDNLKAALYWLKYFPILETLANSLTVITVLAGGWLVIRDEMTLGQLLAVNSMTWALSEPMRQLGALFNDIQRFFASAEKVMDLYYARPQIFSLSDAVTNSEGFEGSIDFDHVTFRYGKHTVLRDVSFSISPGETVGFMGTTGVGKSTVVDLITRLSDADEGGVYVSGVDVRDWSLQELRRHIGVATQEVFLFSDTVEGNIAYGNPDMSDEEVRKAAALSCSDFIESLPEGMNTIIGERGVGLSGGQRQRLALARAIAIRPSILILDDTTSAVDNETEKAIQEHLRSLDFPCTKIIIGQRISSVKDADRIFVLQGGKIAETGTHEELLKMQGVYYEIFAIQQGNFEKAGEV